MSDAIEQAIAEIKEDIESLRRQMKRLVKSDRAQTKKLKWQHKLSMMSLGLIAIGSLTMFRGLTVEDRATLERIAIGVLAMGFSGAIGVNLPNFTPPSEPDRDEDGDEI